MACKNILHDLNFDDFKMRPSGDTHAITIGVNDKIIVTLKHPETGIEITSELTPAIASIASDEKGRVEFKAEYFCHQLRSEVRPC